MKTGSVILDWLGDGGKPVSLDQGEARSQVCRDCPLNTPPNFADWIKRGIAGVIRLHLNMKNDLHLPADKTIGMCSACGCVLNLKVWVPIKHAVDTLSESQLDRLDPKCWVRSEILQEHP